MLESDLYQTSTKQWRKRYFLKETNVAFSEVWRHFVGDTK